VLAAQQQSQPVAWIGLGASSFHPPDVAAWGVDLRALAVVRVPDARGATRAADTLLRSGAFGLVVLDLGCVGQVPVPAQTRLTGLAKKHQAVLLFLTRRDTRHRHSHAGSLGSLVSLRAEGHIERTREPRFRCVIEITKDKLRGPGWRHEEVCHGPDGLR
jgi:recombination protein RecA